MNLTCQIEIYDGQRKSGGGCHSENISYQCDICGKLLCGRHVIPAPDKVQHRCMYWIDCKPTPELMLSKLSHEVLTYLYVQFSTEVLSVRGKPIPTSAKLNFRMWIIDRFNTAQTIFPTGTYMSGVFDHWIWAAEAILQERKADGD